MADVFTRAKRSEVMSRIRGSGNLSTEMRMALAMRAAGIKGWRRRQQLPGKPDFVFRREKVVLFVDGCFWHGCPQHYVAPVSSAAFWRKKIERNRQRDLEVTRELRRRGWRVMRVWEHELKRPDSLVQVIGRLRRRVLLP